MRGRFYSFGMKKCGSNLQVASSAVLRGIEKIECGKDVYFGPNCYIMARESIVFEDEVLIAMNVVIVDANHGKVDGSYRFSRGRQEEVFLGRGCWIAANSVVTAGAKVMPGTVIPPCSTVRKK
jgi:maltose O-acetyltransferase